MVTAFAVESRYPEFNEPSFYDAKAAAMNTYLPFHVSVGISAHHAHAKRVVEFGQWMLLKCIKECAPSPFCVFHSKDAKDIFSI